MAAKDPFSGDLEKDWACLSALWSRTPPLMMAEVGPTWETPAEHRMCLDFVGHYPNSRDFLIGKLSDPSPLIAAYAFKCLIRTADVQSRDIPKAVLLRGETIEIAHHSTVQTQTLAEFFGEYFERYSSQEDLREEEQRTLDWQKNELAQYKRSTQNPPS